MIKDLIIIGGGPAGNAAAFAAARERAGSVLLVEKDALGGTCTNRGCIPTKFFLSRSEHLTSSDAGRGAASASWGKLLSHKNALVRGLSKSIGARCTERGIELVGGHGRFLDRETVEVEKSGGEKEVYRGRRFIIAAGSSPAEVQGAAFDGTCVISSDDALNLAELPASIIIVGSGAVGAEFSFIFRRYGVAVTMVEAAGRLFPQEDPDVGALFRGIYERMGIVVRVGDPVAGVDSRSGRAVVRLASGETLEADKALIGVGRRLLTGKIGCEAAGIALGKRGEVVVDDDLRTSVPEVFAAGDATGRMLLAHVASFQGERAAAKALGMPSPNVPYESIPWAIFTTPEIASVGMTADSAEARGIAVTVASAPLMDNIKARIDRKTDGFMKVVVERSTGLVIGGTVVCPQASDIIHIVAMAIRFGMTVTDMKGICFLHPSIAETYGDMIHAL